MTEGIHGNVDGDYPDYLHDESRRTGNADSISFPRSEDEMRAHLLDAAGRGMSVTVQGARTGIAGGAVPDGGHVLNMSRMNRIVGPEQAGADGGFHLTVQPGVLLSEMTALLHSAGAQTGGDGAGRLFFPPDPTETGASLGGMAACNASGARSFFYGSTRRYIRSARIVLGDGDLLCLKRGGQKAVHRRFAVKTEGGKTIEGNLPAYRLPAVKNAAGYHVRDDMDLLDLFIGSDGTLGIFSEIDVSVIPAPGAVWGLTAFFPSEQSALRFVPEIRRLARERDGDGGRPAAADSARGEGPAVPVAVEFFDAYSLDLLRSQKKTNPAFDWLPDLPAAWHNAVYVEVHGPDEEAVEETVVEVSGRMAACGGDEDATWLGSDEPGLQRLKEFRHAVPEAVNLRIDERRKAEPRLTKLGTDLAVPDEALPRIMALYHDGLERNGFEHVMFGHIGDNHVHVNILPRSLGEYEKGKALYRQWARAAVDMGGTVSAEHGIGKLKRELLEEMYGSPAIEEMRALKKRFDPDGILNPGNLFTAA